MILLATGLSGAASAAVAAGFERAGCEGPSFDTIADGSYPVARPLYFYVKNAHRDVIPGMKEFLAEYMSEAALGSDGYLAERGLTPLSDDKRAEMASAVLEGKKLGM